MNKYKIIALFGPAGAGKDHILNSITKTIWGKNNLHKIISCTTRPPRENEVDGEDYYFVSTEEFYLNNNDLIEGTHFKEWLYGTPLKSLSPEKINIGVFNITGITNLLKHPYCEVLPVRLLATDKTRLLRQLFREANPDCIEICRRFMVDKQDFFVIPFHYKAIDNNTDETQPILQELIEIIKEWSK